MEAVGVRGAVGEEAEAAEEAEAKAEAAVAAGLRLGRVCFGCDDWVWPLIISGAVSG